MKKIQLLYTSKKLPLHVEKIINESPLTSAESPLQLRTENIKRLHKTWSEFFAQKHHHVLTSGTFVHIICGETDPKD